jgi:hypothetical protein
LVSGIARLGPISGKLRLKVRLFERSVAPSSARFTCLLNFSDYVRSGSLDHLNSNGFDCGNDGLFDPPAAFFTGARFGLVLATVCFAAFARENLRAFPRVAEFPLRSFPRFCTFDFFLRLASGQPPVLVGARQHCAGSKDKRLTPQRFYLEDKLCIGAWIARRLPLSPNEISQVGVD